MGKDTYSLFNDPWDTESRRREPSSERCPLKSTLMLLHTICTVNKQVKMCNKNVKLKPVLVKA